MASARAATSADVDDLIGRLGYLPLEQRRFTVVPKAALRDFGLEAEVLDNLVARGLPATKRGSDQLFDASDLHYVALRTGAARAYLAGIGYWQRTFRQVCELSDARFHVRYVPRGAGLWPQGQVGTVLRLDGTRRTIELRPNVPALESEVVASGDWPRLPPAAVEVVEVVSRYELYLRPLEAQPDTALARLSGLADCVTAAELVVEEASDRGLRARKAFGLLLSEPYSVPHAWAELDLGGRWVPVDPLVLGMYRRFTDWNEDGSAAARSPGITLVRVAHGYRPFVSAAGVPVATAFLTTLAAVGRPTPSEAS